MTWVWEDSVWVSEYGKPNIVIFARNYEDKYETKKFIVKGFEPYFYVPDTTAPFDSRATIGLKRVETGVLPDALGRSVRKAITNLPSDVPKIRDGYAFSCEADIPFDKRYMVDNGISYTFDWTDDGKAICKPVDKPLLPRICYFDIEVLGNGIQVPKPDEAAWPIVSIQVMDSYTKSITIFTNGVPQIADDQIACDSEVALLRAFCNYIEKLDPDLLTGWFSNTYDLPYIIHRAEVIGVNLYGMCRLYKKPFARKVGNDWQLRISGRQCFDMLVAFKKYYAPKGGLDAYDIKSVVANKDVVGEGAFSYVDYGDKIVKLFKDEDWFTFLQYCRYDVIALDTIDSGIKLIEFYEYLRMISGVKIEETLMNSRVIESLLMRNGIKPMPTKNYAITVKESFEGAIVLTPPVGVHSNVGVVDLTALYPNIIVGFNISPDVDGIIPKVIKTIMDERDKLRALKLAGLADEPTKNKETVLKYLANSFYGVIGWDKFRLYNVEQAAFVTRTGRELNEYLQLIASNNGMHPIYGDTDSVFITGIDTPENGIKFQELCNDELAKWSLDKGSSVNFTLKFEKLYRKLMFKMAISGQIAKKRYAGHLIWKDGFAVDKLDMTGIELKRSDQALITKTILRQFLNDILLRDDIDGAIDKLYNTVQLIKQGKVNIHELGIPRGLHSDKDNPWTRGVNNLEKHFGITLQDGIKPRLIYCKGAYNELCIGPDVDVEVILNGITIDWDEICKKTVENKMKTYVESIGKSWDVIINGQTSLFDY